MTDELPADMWALKAMFGIVSFFQLPKGFWLPFGML